MLPLNYALLKYFTSVSEASADMVLNALQETYGEFRAFNKKSIGESLMTAEANDLLQESRYELDENDELVIYYSATPESRASINRFIT
ncbi:MAG: hypothetical protein LBL54_00430 [Clostridiales Family XIII bacterium]|jgi:molybdopterin converting factor small subunit|nr:hypothetical protein [Clostridiales Family XIII bacterium]